MLKRKEDVKIMETWRRQRILEAAKSEEREKLQVSSFYFLKPMFTLKITWLLSQFFKDINANCSSGNIDSYVGDRPQFVVLNEDVHAVLFSGKGGECTPCRPHPPRLSKVSLEELIENPDIGEAPKNTIYTGKNQSQKTASPKLLTASDLRGRERSSSVGGAKEIWKHSLSKRIIHSQSANLRGREYSLPRSSYRSLSSNSRERLDKGMTGTLSFSALPSPEVDPEALDVDIRPRTASRLRKADNLFPGTMADTVTFVGQEHATQYQETKLNSPDSGPGIKQRQMIARKEAQRERELKQTQELLRQKHETEKHERKREIQEYQKIKWTQLLLDKKMNKLKASFDKQSIREKVIAVSQTARLKVFGPSKDFSDDEFLTSQRDCAAQKTQSSTPVASASLPLENSSDFVDLSPPIFATDELNSASRESRSPHRGNGYDDFFAGAENPLDKKFIEKGIKASAARARKALQEIAGACKERRKEITATKEAMEAKK